jgi:hypothetical protein
MTIIIRSTLALSWLIFSCCVDALDVDGVQLLGRTLRKVSPP